MYNPLISRGFSEALGRMPDQGGWYHWQNANLTPAQIVNNFFKSAEYTNLNLNNKSKVETLYRMALGRETDPSGFAAQLNYLDNGGDFNTLISNFTNSAEFKSIDFNQPVFNKTGLPSVGFTKMSEDELEVRLHSGEKEIKLPPQTVVELYRTLKVPPGVTLSTDNEVGSHYTEKARFIRTWNYDNPMISIESGGHLKNVWVSGNRNAFPGRNRVGENVRLESGEGSSVENIRSDGSDGYTNIWVTGSGNYGATGPSSTMYVLNNFVVGDENSYANFNVCDGISIGCEAAIVTGNSVLNATDVGIIPFSFESNTGDVPPNHSQIYNNVIANLATSAFGGLVTCPNPNIDEGNPDFVVPIDSPFKASRSFEGLEIRDNLIWTSDSALFNVALSVGSRLWGTVLNLNSVGGTIENNSSGEGIVNAYYGVVINGALDVVVKNNTFNFSPTHLKIENAIALSSGYASGEFDIHHYQDVDVFEKLLVYQGT